MIPIISFFISLKEFDILFLFHHKKEKKKTF